MLILYLLNLKMVNNLKVTQVHQQQCDLIHHTGLPISVPQQLTCDYNHFIHTAKYWLKLHFSYPTCISHTCEGNSMFTVRN